jgi:hypothetical protein
MAEKHKSADELNAILQAIKGLDNRDYITILTCIERGCDVTDDLLEEVREWVDDFYMEKEISLYSEWFKDFINGEYDDEYADRNFI